MNSSLRIEFDFYTEKIRPIEFWKRCLVEII